MVTDEGQPQTLVSFSHGDEPLNLILLLDISGSMQKHIELIAQTARDALAHLRPGDRVAIMVFAQTQRGAPGLQRQSGGDGAPDREGGAGSGRRQHARRSTPRWWMRRITCKRTPGPDGRPSDSDSHRQSEHELSADRRPGDPRAEQSRHGVQRDRDRARDRAQAAYAQHVPESGLHARQCDASRPTRPAANG